ncbi:MAG: heparinase II/III family protein [Hyphomicrobium sp.]
MALTNVAERARVALMKVDRSRRSVVSRLLYSPFLRWRYGPSTADHLLIVPQDLRTSDPSFWREVQQGQFGLAGTMVVLGQRSPFDFKAVNADWARALHGFSWLSHLKAAADDGARETARRLTVEWTIRHGRGHGLAFEPAVAGRRLISWLSHASFLLEDADAATYDAITRALGADLIRLSASWRDGADGYPRLLALTALVLADLCIAGHDTQLPESERALSAELSRQILPDGGHISRNPGVLVELMLDLLPLKQCFASRGRPAPPGFLATMQRMLAMLRYMRMGDGMLARFNGMSVASPAGLATVLAYDDRSVAPLAESPYSRYLRLERGRTVLLMDVGRAPPLEQAGYAHAGCLSFELSSGTSMIFANGGAPAAADSDWRAAARSTASHNTLTLADQSSSKLIRNRDIERLIGAPPIQGPDTVYSRLEEAAGALELSVNHDGYLSRCGLIHRRSLVLSASGQRLLGVDSLEGPKANLRLRNDLPFSIHFHVHPEAVCRRVPGGGAAEVVLKGGEVWRFSVENSALTIEESTYYADSAGPRASLQLLIRGATFGDSQVRWVFEAMT